MKCIAVDIGATSGRVMTVTYENGIFSYREDKRFVNRIYDDGGTLRWDFPLLLDNIVSGIHEALRKDPAIRTVGIERDFLKRFRLPKSTRSPASRISISIRSISFTEEKGSRTSPGPKSFSSSRI